MQDLNTRDQVEFVLMSNKQKGLVKEIGEFFPDVVKRNSAQHIYCNFKKKHREQLIRDKFWEFSLGRGIVSIRRRGNASTIGRERGNADARGSGNAPIRGRGNAYARCRGNASPKGRRNVSGRPDVDVVVESESNVEILKIVRNSDVDLSVPTCEQRVVKRKLTKMKQESLKKKEKS
ncbi:hypothetical protein LIER_27007 [Lithospermum erythrorhizon]|uniref:Uncharacterized protein n=1 Tax=Lithospermum erythrorhizon TaxID=34254 RepID=A0AAV3RAQ1_LITER